MWLYIFVLKTFDCFVLDYINLRIIYLSLWEYLSKMINYELKVEKHIKLTILLIKMKNKMLKQINDMTRRKYKNKRGSMHNV